MAKKGNNLDETYGLNIIVFELPNLDSKEEFVEYIKDGRAKDTDPERFKIIRDEINIYEDFVDYCVTYYSAAEDKKAKKRSKNKDPMILEMAGYVCRHPKNKNLAVDFDFSHRYYKGHEDKKLVPMAKEFFKNLKL